MAIQPAPVEIKRTAANAWNLSVGPDICSNVQAGLDREWYVANGLGGYAAGSLVGATTRSYHGLLVAALRPPVERDVLITKIDETIELPDKRALKLGVNEYHDGTIDPQGYNYLDTFSLEGRCTLLPLSPRRKHYTREACLDGIRTEYNVCAVCALGCARYNSQ